MPKNIDTVEEFWSWDTIRRAQKNANEKSIVRFLEEFLGFLGTPESIARCFPSGHSALETLLVTRKDNTTGVMAPAFNCRRVQDAVEESGCTLKTYDFSPEPGSFDWQAVEEAVTPEIGVIIVTHYYGVPVDLREIRDFCREREIILIEDCAHTLGGYVGEHQVGTWGDAAIFSFNYDKPISLGWGGLGVVNSLGRFRCEDFLVDEHVPPDLDVEISSLDKFVKTMEARRSSIPQGKNKVSRDFSRLLNKMTRLPVSKNQNSFGRIQAELGSLCLESYSDVRSIRNNNACLFASLCPQPTWSVGSSVVHPAWLKQKMFVPSSEKLAMISSELKLQGVRAGNFNWPKLIEGATHQSCPNAEEVTTCWMDVPIHQRMSSEEIRSVVSLVKRYF
ncbi:DegT/DnrJ/EryC1/StrS family aminotransferase [Spiribacter vilamensis]|uniref:dTDP-4-amino-4,6-dideoxygalactose transaminase n=1 Tax=Spiribacter vilamensis TaxID=531306 RepID=A0A4Q8D2Q0_9GAMM|nr:DegT/DnrJ/EryC1/StrS family aminotransferase [Spiribacter vilamensis]RZU99597.1 dTDP-4-amino-4,6-dideoxygalactose transaminase [Spiribacter vilamensis]